MHIKHGTVFLLWAVRRVSLLKPTTHNMCIPHFSNASDIHPMKEKQIRPPSVVVGEPLSAPLAQHATVVARNVYLFLLVGANDMCLSVGHRK